MTCADVMDAASPFLDGELGEEQRGSVAAHLSSCADCAREVDALRRLDGLLAAVPPVSAARRRRPGWALAACLLLAFAGTWLVQPAPSRHTVQMSKRSYQVTVEGATLLSMEVHDSREEPIRFENGSER